jgi:amino acid adenylation domain-containing protein
MSKSKMSNGSRADAPGSEGREAQLLAALSQRLAHHLHVPVGEIDPHRPFLALGADSMVLLEMTHVVEREYGVHVAPHQLFEQLTDLAALAGHIARHEPVEPPPAGRAAAPTDRLRAVVARQLDVMSQQLRLLSGGRAAVERAPVSLAAVRPAEPARAPTPSEPPAAPPVRPLRSPQQQRHLDELIRRYNGRTAASKRHAERYRDVLADRRATAGFSVETKEVQYPIVGAGGRGSRLWDVDGNEYIDLAMGFGVHLFGHAPAFLRDAIAEQLAQGAQIGPQCARAGELAERLVRLTGLDRVTFCNSGTEAVMTALRLARAATGRNGVVMFRGSYHGHSDGTLALGRRGDGHASIPMAPGIPQGAIDDVIVLDYNDPRSLDAIRGAAGRLAAVLVEPIQSRWPEVQPRDFLHQLRALTRELDIALIFDEVITGFRVHPRGAQGRFGVTADIATYGKLVGGGMPIGVVAGARRYLDRIDGGAWRFGDDSHPAVETTFFAGTFSKHPLAVAAALAVLREIDARGQGLYDQLDARTARLAAGMNRVFDAADVSLAVVGGGSIFRIAPRGGADRTNYLHESTELRLLYHHLILRGIYVWEGRTGFLSTAHSDEDVDRIIAATGEALAELQGGGWFARSAAAPAPAAHAAPAAEPRRAPLSWAQEGIWLQSQLEAGTGSFNMPGGVRLRGALRVDALERAIREVVRRHAVLRTRFAVVDGRPEQVIAPAGEVELAIDQIDPHGKTVRQLALDEARRPFDLERGPLVRACLIAIAADEWVLLVTLHHLIGDGWSFAVFVDEVAALYRGLCDGALPALPAPALSYAEYAIRQRRDMDDATAERQLAHWKQQLDGAPASLALPTDRPRRGGPARSATLAQTVEPALLRALHELARTTQATLHMVLLAGYAALLQRHSGQDDLVIGAPVTTRDRAELRGVMGPFVNTVVFRLAVERDRGFEALVQRARTATLGAYANQDVPFARVVEAVRPERLPDQHPVFQVWFNLEPDSGASELQLPGLEVALIDDQIDTPTQLDLSLGAELRGGVLVLKWIYNEALFDPATIHHLAEQFVHLLAQVAADRSAPLARHSLVTAEAARMLPDPGAPLVPAADAADPARVADAFAQQVDQAPNHPAIAHGQRRWSYAELWRASVAFADDVARSTRRGDVVAVRGAPSFGLVAAMLGTLLDDRVLLPIDPGLPVERQAVMLREAGARCLVTAGDAAWTVAPVGAGETAAAGALPRQLGDAYVFYTSGTTGMPRAVLGTHRGLGHFLAWQRTAFDVGPGDRIAQTIRLSFDAVLRDVFLPLTSGATLVLPEDGDLAEPDATLAWLERQRITLVHTVPSLGQHWTARADGRACLPDLRCVFFAGEPLQAELVQRWQQLAPVAEVINFYGPTETTMIRCYHRVPDPPPAGVQPAGIPLPDTQALVLTPEHARCGVGEIGEIVLRTAYGTRGYLNAPDDPRFIANPHAHDGIGLYCTGDRGRYRADGQLQILGRTDRQIKLRGVRIELAELESVLGEHPQVRQASVQLLGEPPAGRLVAFLVADDGARQADVLAFLRVRLPDAMIPARLVFVRELPRLGNGKVDARALAALAAAPATERVAPATPTQVLVADHARQLLAVAELGIHDNFFELGGHSLLAAQLVARLRAALGIELNLRALFDAPTVAGLAEHIDGKAGASERALALALKARNDDRATESIEL